MFLSSCQPAGGEQLITFKAGESLKDRLSFCLGLRRLEPAPVGVYYVSSGSQLALHAGATPQFQIRDATETC